MPFVPHNSATAMNSIATPPNGSLLPDFVATLSARGLWADFSELVNLYPLASLYVALVLVLLVLLLLLRSRRARRDVRVYQEDGGYAAVSQKALRHLIQIACEGAGLASSPKIQFCQVRGRIHVELGIKLYQSQRLSQVHEQLRQRIRNAVEETHGIEVGDVSLKVLGFRKDPYYNEEGAVAVAEPELTTPGEASATSLYEESATDEALPAGESAAVVGGESEDTVAEPTTDKATADKATGKRGFRLFGRKKQEADTLFVSEEQDSDSGADAEGNTAQDASEPETKA